MSNTASTITILATFVAAFGGWSFWLKAYLETRFAAIDTRLDRIDGTLDRIDGMLRDHAERLTRLEAH